MAQASTASSLSKGKDISPTAATAAPFSVSPLLIAIQISWSVPCLIVFSFFLKDLRGVISSLEVFASRFTSLEADKVRLQEEVESSSSKLDGAVKIAAAARQEIDSLKEELARLKEKLKEEEASRLATEARAAEKDEVLRQSSLALLGNF
jgi:peptidoglycan hydrolase CwlO-like protein